MAKLIVREKSFCGFTWFFPAICTFALKITCSNGILNEKRTV